jgi:hypothetical protein
MYKRNAIRAAVLGVCASVMLLSSTASRAVACGSCALDPGMINAHNTFARRITLAQTFTPTATGYLTQVTHGLQGLTGSVTTYDLLITTTTGGLPTWTGGAYNVPGVMYSATNLTIFATLGIVNGVVPIPFGNQPGLTAGIKYALILVPKLPATGMMYWRGNSSAGAYAAGSAYELSGTTWSVPTTGPKDHGFRLNGLCP